MADARSIIVGGGIQAGTPFTLGSLTRIINTNPATIADSIAFQRTQTAVEVITVGTNSFPTAIEKLQVIGGFISDTGVHDNFIAGRGASGPAVVNARNVIIGTLASVPAGNTESVVIGYLSTLQNAGGSSVIVGANNTQGAGFPTPTTVVGASNTFNNAFSGPGVGTGSTWQGANVGIGNQQSFSAVNNGVAVGRLCQLNANSGTVVGDDARVDHAVSVALGRGARTLVANSFIVGGVNLGITTVHFGEGDTSAAPANVTYRHTNGVGTDIPGANVTIAASRGTGNAATQGRVIFATGAVAAATGAGLQASTPRLSVLPSTGLAAAAILALDNFTDGVGVAAESVLNAPSANVAVYVPVLYNGANLGYLKIIPA